MSMPVLEIAWQEAKEDFQREHTTPYIWDNPHRFRIGNVEWETDHNFSLEYRFAIDIKLKNASNKVYVLMGNGELNEGSNWEAYLTASVYQLNNLTVIIDRNRFQANITTENLIPIEPIEEKFKAII